MNANIPLKRVARVQYGLGQPPKLSDYGVPILRATNITRGKITESGLLRAKLEDLPIERAPLLREGEILVVRSGAYTGDSARVSGKWIGSAPGYDLRVTPQGADSRYLAHSLLSSVALDQMKLASSRAAQPHLNADELGGVELWFPSLDEQRRIADFLDAETARMAQLTTALHRFDQDVRERERTVLANVLNADTQEAQDDLPSGWRWTPLMHLTDQFRQIMYGIVLPGPNVPDGVPIVKGGDVAANRLSLATLNRTTHEVESSYERSRLIGGDLVIAIRGSVGELATVPTELAGANLTQDAARISIGASTNRNWLRLVLGSPLVAHQIQKRITGATIKGINIWDLKRVMIPTPNPAVQKTLAQKAGGAIATHEALRSRVAQHRKLVAERRQALITAAVTGQFDVSTASGRNVTDGVTA
ncbi:restriction endonuclease subunit S [Streptomyces sp. SM10]|uniref:restriction endonuclease subunit S n=1 Tax=Streptomyces sp. SM10 TaxID=565556 RepID=UPI000CD4DCE0|nr:restriction endonuclease subunit S [Streptomyces sp. SM10]